MTTAVLDLLARVLDRRAESMIGGPILGGSAGQSSHRASSEFTVGFRLEPGTDPRPILAQLDQYLAQLQGQALRADSLESYRFAAGNWIVRAYEAFDSRAIQLSMSPVGGVVSPHYLEQRYLPITAQDVARVAQQWLPRERRVILHVRSDGDAPMGGRVVGIRDLTGSFGATSAAGGLGGAR